MFIVDFHSHILPGIDDGSSDIQMSDAMLKEAASQGVNVQVLTPHFYASKMNIDSFIQKRDLAVQQILPIAQKNKIRIRVGAEVAYFNNMSESESIEKFFINGTRILLIEMPFRQWTSKEVREIESFEQRGVLVMFAHLDRYLSFQKDKEPLNDLLAMKTISQINAESLTTFFSRHKVLKTIGDNSFVLGSDAHNMEERAPNLIEGREVILAKMGQETLNNVDSLSNFILGYKVV